MSYTRKRNETAILTDGVERSVSHNQWKRNRAKRLENNLKRKQNRSGYHCPPKEDCSTKVQNNVIKEQDILIKKTELKQLSPLPSPAKQNALQTFIQVCHSIFSFLASVFVSLYQSLKACFTPDIPPEPSPSLPQDPIDILYARVFINEELRSIYGKADSSPILEKENPLDLAPPRVSSASFLSKPKMDLSVNMDRNASKNRIPSPRGL